MVRRIFAMQERLRLEDLRRKRAGRARGSVVETESDLANIEEEEEEKD